LIEDELLDAGAADLLDKGVGAFFFEAAAAASGAGVLAAGAALDFVTERCCMMLLHLRGDATVWSAMRCIQKGGPVDA